MRYLVLLLSVLLTGCPSDDTKASPSTSASSVIYTWEEGSIYVTKNYNDPSDSSTVPISYAVHRAKQPERKIGSLWFNFGGPGSATIEQLQWTLEQNLISSEIINRFDLVGFDPRGTGQSAFAEEFRQCALTKNCDDELAQYAPYMGTNSLVQDMEALRNHLNTTGEYDQINLLGYSYGTRAFSAYAHKHGEHVRALVLDGMDTLGDEYLKQFEEKVRNWIEVQNKKLASMANLRAKEPLFENMETLFDSKTDKLILTNGNEVPEEDAFKIADLLFGLGAESNEEESDNYVLTAINCTDRHRSYDQSHVDLFIDNSAFFLNPSLEDIKKDSFKELVQYCVNWPYALDPLPNMSNLHSKLLHPALILSAENDIATPHRWATQTTNMLDKQAHLETVQGLYEHGISFSGSECLDDMVTNYFINVETPDYSCDFSSHTTSVLEQTEQEILAILDNYL